MAFARIALARWVLPVPRAADQQQAVAVTGRIRKAAGKRPAGAQNVLLLRRAGLEVLEGLVTESQGDATLPQRAFQALLGSGLALGHELSHRFASICGQGLRGHRRR